MSDLGRKDLLTKAKEAMVPNSTKSDAQIMKEQTTGAADHTARNVQPDSTKSTTQETADMMGRSGQNASTTTAGTGTSIIDTVKHAFGMDQKSTTTSATDPVPANNPASSNYGPHSSNIANKLDPSVDSDRDGRGPLNFTGSGGSTVHSATTNRPGSSTHGPHASNVANKLDPTIDSDLDGRSGVTRTGRTTASGETGITSTPHNTTNTL